MLIDFRERGREKERETETSMWERNSYQLPPAHAATRDQTRNLGTWPELYSKVATPFYPDTRAEESGVT